MLANYGYRDGSGDYFITIDTDKCDGCGKCVTACPRAVLEILPDEMDPMSNASWPVVKVMHRNSIKYTCGPCKPTKGTRALPCVESCNSRAIAHSW